MINTLNSSNNKTLNERIGENLRYLRKNNKINSQDRMCFELKKVYPTLTINQDKLSKIENGTTSICADVLLAYSRYFNISIDEIINGEPFIKKENEEKQEFLFSDVVILLDKLFSIYPIVDIKKYNDYDTDCAFALLFNGNTPLYDYIKDLLEIKRIDRNLSNKNVISDFNIEKEWYESILKKAKNYNTNGKLINNNAESRLNFLDLYHRNHPELPFD